MVTLRSLALPLLLLGAAAAEDGQFSPSCGAGFGDLREVAKSQSACAACRGRLLYDPSAADGLGYTSCVGGHAPPAPTQPTPPQPSCGGGVGDLRNQKQALSQCQACKGTLEYKPSEADGLGYTHCVVHRRLKSGGRGRLLRADDGANSASCGAGFGDKRQAAASQSACQACHGVLTYDGSAADGVGYTACYGGRVPQEGPAPAVPAPCGVGVGDLRQAAASQSACGACQGTLTYFASAADGLGYTDCTGSHAPVQEGHTPSAPALCGAGVGDLREVAASQSACGACQGTLTYDVSAADGLGYTSCTGSHEPVQEGHTPSAPAPPPAPCGAGVGDLREVAASQSACGACQGTLTYDVSAADGLGYTACAGGRAQQEDSHAHSLACGAGVGDLREQPTSRSACEACRGSLEYDAAAADGLGYTTCVGAGASQPIQEQHEVAPQTFAEQDAPSWRWTNNMQRVLFLCVFLSGLAIVVALRQPGMYLKAAARAVVGQASAREFPQAAAEAPEKEPNAKHGCGSELRAAAAPNKEAVGGDPNPDKGMVSDLYLKV